jgi:hypothetical protein
VRLARKLAFPKKTATRRATLAHVAPSAPAATGVANRCQDAQTARQAAVRPTATDKGD